VTSGVVDGLADCGAALIGGNVSGTDGPLSCDLTLIGDCPRGAAWRRRARPGDDVVVAGSLGEAAAGLSLLRAEKPKRTGRLVRAFTHPRPLLEVAAALSGQPGVRGAIDVSDGFATDLIHVCRASGVGCEIDAGALPLSRALAAFCRERRADPYDWILRGGEDYALILAVSPRHIDRLTRRAESRAGCHLRVVGRFTANEGAHYVVRGGKRLRLRALGWDHMKSSQR
jgi:thiamine-monophosphate kinase